MLLTLSVDWMLAPCSIKNSMVSTWLFRADKWIGVAPFYKIKQDTQYNTSTVL